jgi:hypothetical protein
MSVQTLVIKVPTDLSRHVRAFVDDSDAYGDISEFAAVALGNQLSLESPEEGIAEQDEQGDGVSPLLRMPAPRIIEPPSIAQLNDSTPLFVLTNRLFPIKVACRVAANLTDGRPLALRELNRTAAEVARGLGESLRHEDEEANRKGQARRWIGLPVSADKDPALRRFASSFMLHTDGSGTARGPMAQLGLAEIVGEDHEAQLTETGWQLAVAASPILDQSGDGTLGPAERAIFTEALRRQPSERQAALEFIDFLEEGGGVQSEVDARLATQHPDWSPTRVTSHRAAMLGRMSDLGLVSVEGRGDTALITLAADAAAGFEEER